MNDVRQIALNFLREAHGKFGGSITALARAAGVSPSTLSRPLNDPEFEFVPRLSTLTKVGQAAGMMLPRELRGLDVPENPEGEPAPFRSVPVVGVIWPGAWIEYETEEDQEVVFVPRTLLPHAALAAYSMGRKTRDPDFPPGSQVIVAQPDDVHLLAGDCVVVERIRDGLSEFSIRTVEPQHGGTIHLVGRPRFNEDDFVYLAMFGEVAGETSEIKGVVVAAYREGRFGSGPHIEDWDMPPLGTE